MVDKISDIQAPEYLKEQAREYHNSSLGYAARTIALSVAADQYRCDLMKERGLNQRAIKRLVTQVLKKNLRIEGSVASRVFDINEVSKRAESFGLHLNKVPSQGILFALASANKTIDDKNFAKIINDASSGLSIKEFREKWCPKRRSRQIKSLKIVRWILEEAEISEVQKIYEAASSRIQKEKLVSSQA